MAPCIHIDKNTCAVIIIILSSNEKEAQNNNNNYIWEKRKLKLYVENVMEQKLMLNKLLCNGRLYIISRREKK